ncbi:MAG TPA: TonB-dependent receptor, partial [Burkholderiaceae bacterium]
MRPSIHRAGSVPALSGLALLIAAGFAALPAAAQTQPTPAAESQAKDKEAADKAAQLERVTVSATRRREPVRDVPLRVETLDATSLERSGATSLSDTIGTLPGVDVKADSGPGRSAITMRGVSLGEQTIATVGVYVDEVAFGSSSAFVAGGSMALDMGLLDLHHVELLRGPQGTLYGAGAMGGLLKYVTNEPDSSQFSGKVGLGVRSTQDGGMGHAENLVLNVPLSKDVAAVRVAAFNDHEGGYVKAIGRAAGDNTNDGNTRGARVSVLIEPMAKMKIRLASTGQEVQRNGLNAIDYDIATGQPQHGDLTRALSVGEPYKIKTRLSSADFEYDLGWARLNAVASTQNLDGQTGQDATAFLGGSPAFDYAVLDNTIKLRKQTQELRLTSQRGTVEWLLGYYRDKEIGRVSQRLWAKLAGAGNMDLQGNGQPSEYREQAFYGDLTWNIDPLWSLTLGARVARNQQVYAVEGTGPTDFVGNSAETSKTYLGTLRYALDKDSNVYFRAASGYRPGGPDGIALDATTLQPIPGTPKMFGHDTLWSYELGYKADLLDKRLSLEAAAYQINWTDLQQPKALGISTIIVNAGAARVRGLELAARYTVDSQWSWNASLAYTDPKLSEDTPDLGPAGTRMANTAKLAYTLGLRYAFTLAGHGSSVGLNLRHVGQRNAGYDDPGSSIPQFSQPAYTMVDG